MFKRLWWLTLLVLVSVTSFAAMNAAAYPNPASAEVDSTIVANALSPPMVTDKTLHDAKMVSNTTLAISGDEDNGAILPTDADTTEGGRYDNVAMNRFETVFSGDSEVTHPAVIVCDLLTLHYGYISPKFPGKNGQNIDANRSTLPEVVYIGNMSGPGDGEAYFAITCDSLAFSSDITDPVQQASGLEFQTRSVTPEVVYLGDRSGGGTGELHARSVTPEVVYLGEMSGAGDCCFLPKQGNEFAVVCGEDGC